MSAYPDPQKPEIIKEFVQRRQDSIIRSTIGEENWKRHVVRRHLDRVCYQCPHVQHDGDTLDVCSPPSDFQCMRQHEKDLIDSGVVVPE